MAGKMHKMAISLTKSRKRDRSFRRRQSKTWCRVYVIREAEGAPARYVGQTRQSAEMRLWWHFKDIKRREARGWPITRLQKWLLSLANPPLIEVLDENGVWDITEAVWIDRLRRANHPLFNRASVVPD
jgi:hypothetical protein